MRTIVVMNLIMCVTSNLFHEGSRLLLNGHSGGYFGYSVLLKNDGKQPRIIIGAPKAESSASQVGHTGALYDCPLTLTPESSQAVCDPYKFGPEKDDSYKYSRMFDYFKDDMWLGAAIASVSNDTLLACAPRWVTPYTDKHLLANGLCYIISKSQENILLPLTDSGRQAFLTDGKRHEYGEYGTHLNYYAYAQAGMSIKVTEDNNSVLIGAPGLLQWTGGVVQYQVMHVRDYHRFVKQPTSNPYFTKEMGPDEYFGYSVESGVFESKGNILYVAGAPRAKGGLGRVLVFEPTSRESAPLNIRASVVGSQLGAYFGSYLCSVDINGDGLTDLLVGAPNYVNLNDDLPYDQGSVFIYITVDHESGFILKPAGSVTGSNGNGARFGSAIANLGDIDKDGYPEVAVGAPYENNGRGAVYIYKSNQNGLTAKYTQRISPLGARGFGIAISRGIDVDNNGCNDLGVGAYVSEEAYVFRCIPTITVKTSIIVPDALDLPQNATNFTTLFCIKVAPELSWRHPVELKLNATILVDQLEGRAVLTGDSEYTVTVSPGKDLCEEQVVDVNPRADLSRPISLSFNIKPTVAYPSFYLANMPRLSEKSILHSSLQIQLTRDCGEDLICEPKLDVILELLCSSPYVPGSGDRFGVAVTVFNIGEPAYGAHVNLTLPASPLRVPSPCDLLENVMICDLPTPLHRNENVTWVIDLEYVQTTTEEKVLSFKSELHDSLYKGNGTNSEKKIAIWISPQANFTAKGKTLQNATITISRNKLTEGGLVTFIHFFEITNFGPSDWPNLEAKFQLTDQVSLSSGIQGCNGTKDLQCSFSIPANVSIAIALPLRFDLREHGDTLYENGIFNASTILTVQNFNLTTIVTSSLVLDPATPWWPIAVGCIVGLIVLAGMVYGLYKCGFFARKRPEISEENENTQNSDSSEHDTAGTSQFNESTHELLHEDSE